MQIKKVHIKEIDFDKLLERAGLTLSKLSELSGIHKSNLSDYRLNKKIMTEEIWNKIKKVLDNN